MSINPDKYTIESYFWVDDSAIDAAIAIQSELSIAGRLFANRVKESEEGFLISGHSHAAIADTIENGGGALFLVRDNSSDENVGYLLARDPKPDDNKLDTATRDWVDDTTRGRYERILDRKEYVYLDQVGMLWNHHGNGAAAQLLTSFEENFEGRDIVTLVMLKPITNKRSRAFFTKMGYTEACHLSFMERVSGIENKVSAVFVKSRKSETDLGSRTSN
jgi:GNAT superfamily N-acetyltransferase